MCFPGNKHADFDADLQQLINHCSVGGVLLIARAVGAVRTIQNAQKAMRPQNLMMRNARSSINGNATIYYVSKRLGNVTLVCIADDRRNGPDYCLNLLVIDATQPGGNWIVNTDPFTKAADRS